MFLTESIRSLSSRREDWIGETEEDLEGEELWFGRGSGLRTDRKDKEEESERDGFDERYIVVRLVQAIVLDLVLREDTFFFFLFGQSFGITLSMFFDCKKKEERKEEKLSGGKRR